MTSKISCVKLIRENIRHRIWLAALCAVAFLLMMPVYSILYLNSMNGPGYEQDPDQLSFFLDYLPTLFNCSRLALFACTFAILVLLCALTGSGISTPGRSWIFTMHSRSARTPVRSVVSVRTDHAVCALSHLRRADCGCGNSIRSCSRDRTRSRTLSPGSAGRHSGGFRPL